MAMKQKELDTMLDELVRDRSPEEILGETGLVKELTRRLVERALEGEMAEHLGYERHATSGTNSGNSRNGTGSKTVLSDTGPLEIAVPRDRNGAFEPQLVEKRQRRLPGFDDKVIALYARGMTTREIQGHLKELYGTEVSPALISSVTDAVLDDVKAWQNRALSSVYPIVYLDAIHVKMRNSGRVESCAVYLALAVNLEGNKELLGLWIGAAEGAKFWLSVLTELQSRGVQDILIACVDGLKGFPDAIESVFPRTEIQLCIVHLVRNSLRYVSWKERKAVARDLKQIYNAPTVEAAEQALAAFEATWAERFPVIGRIWRDRWEQVIPLFSYPDPIRRAIYTTNAIESLNASLKRVTKKRGAFPTPDAVRKVLYLAIERVSARWSRPIRNWTAALNHFAIAFEGRVRL